MKTIRLITLTAILSALAWTTACQSGNAAKTEANNQPVAKTPADTINTETRETSAGSLTTPTEAYKAAFAARQQKDLVALKQVLSKKMLDFFTRIGAAEQKTLDDELKELVEQPQAAAPEARNEKINGDKATLEYLDEHGKWRTMDFVKETGRWKLTMPEMQPPVIENKPGK